MTPASRPRMISSKRRNGKLQSCEPCRKRKLSCDHRLPTCGRCLHRKMTNDCYYHPAPLTKHVESVPEECERPSPPPLPLGEHIQVQQASGKFSMTRSDTQTPLERFEIIQWVPSAGILMETSMTRDDGFLGESSSSAVVAELNNSLGVQPSEIIGTPEVPCLADVASDSGVNILAFFLDVDKIGEMLNRAFNLIGGQMFRPVYLIWWKHLAPVLQILSESSAQDKLERMSRQISRNTQSPLVCGQATTAREYALEATGKKLRWETLGLLLSMIGTLCGKLPGWDPIFDSSRGTKFEKTMLTQTTLHYTDTCVELSKRCGARNDMFACLVYDRVVLTAQVRGESSSEVWQAFGEVSGLVVLMGLHLGARIGDDTPFFLSELRVRLFNAIYSADKFLSTFLGRPPHISYRYSLVQLRHDLSDEEVCLDKAGREAALSHLKNGWATTGHPQLSTWRRAWSLRHTLREDVLEIVIGPHSDDMEARVSHVHAREKAALEAMPEFVHTEPQWLTKGNPWEYEIPGRGVKWRALDVQCYISIHRGIRHSNFLLERAIVNKGGSDCLQLITSARSLLTLVLRAFALKDFLRDYQIDFTDMLAFYAVPPAGVLAMEMLRRDQINDPGDSFPRCETLQQLTVLVPALEAVRSDEGNYSICAMGLNAIRKVLDRLLAERRRSAASFEDDHDHQLYANMQFSANFGNDADFSLWLGSLDFDTASCLETLSAVGGSEGVMTMNTSIL